MNVRPSMREMHKRAGFDLSRMVSVNMKTLIEALTISDIVMVFYPSGKHVMIKGGSLVCDAPEDDGSVTTASVTPILIANDTQESLVSSALEVIKQQKMGDEQVETLRRLLVMSEIDDI